MTMPSIDPRRLVRGAVLCVLMPLLAACVTGPTVRIDRAPGADLSGARSYGWVSELGTDRADYESLVTMRLKRAVGNALEARGLRYDEDAPDVRVNFYVNLEERQEVRRLPASSPMPVGGYDVGFGLYHGYRMGLYDPWPDYDIEVQEYQQGTLTIDVVDARTRRLAWEGVAEGRVTRKALDEPDEVLDRAVARMFEKFP
jgi:hypothetical protein